MSFPSFVFTVAVVVICDVIAASRGARVEVEAGVYIGLALGWLLGYYACWGRRVPEKPITADLELVEALRDLVKANEEWNAAVEASIGRPPRWTDGYLDRARAAIAKAGGDQ